MLIPKVKSFAPNALFTTTQTEFVACHVNAGSVEGRQEDLQYDRCFEGGQYAIKIGFFFLAVKF